MQELHPVRHPGDDAALGAVLGQIQIGGHDPVQLFHMRLAQVVLRHGDVGFQDFSLGRVLPGGQAHVNPGGVGAAVDDFGRRLPGDGPMQLVLDGGEELLRHGRVGAVIHRQRAEISDFLVEPPLAGADFPDALQQFVEIVPAEHLFALLQTFIIQHEALGDELAQCSRGPDAELGGLVAVHPVADGDDGVEVVELHLAGNRPATFGPSYFHFGNSCFAAQFTRLEDVFQVFVDGRDIDAEQLRQRLLGEPDGFLTEEHIHLHRPVRRGVEEKLAGCGFGFHAASVVISSSSSEGSRSLPSSASARGGVWR